MIGHSAGLEILHATVLLKSSAKVLIYTYLPKKIAYLVLEIGYLQLMQKHSLYEESEKGKHC